MSSLGYHVLMQGDKFGVISVCVRDEFLDGRIWQPRYNPLSYGLRPGLRFAHSFRMLCTSKISHFGRSVARPIRGFGGWSYGVIKLTVHGRTCR